MSSQDVFMADARQHGACYDCCYVRDAFEVKREHPECYRKIIDAMHRIYGNVPNDELRMRLYRDGVR